MNPSDHVNPLPSGYDLPVTTPWDLIDAFLQDCPNGEVSIPEDLDLNAPISIYPTSWDIKFEEVAEQ